jgi:hypothetical protein
MSQKTKRILIVGGSVLGVVVICLVVGALALSRYNRLGLSPSLVSRGITGGGVGEYAGEADYAEYEMPAAEPQAVEEMAVASNGDYGVPDVTLEQVQIDRLIIRNGSISMVVDDTRLAKASIEQMVAGMAGEGAFIVSSSEYGGSETEPYINMSIRIPAERFDEVMDQLEAMAVEGTNPSLNEYSEDVTEEYVDLQARIESMEAARDRLLELMQGAETTEDLLMAEQQLTQREAEIEALKGRLRYLTEAARLSRIDIDLQPYILSQPVDTRWRPAETVREAFNALVDGLRNFGDFLIFFAIAVLPWLVLFGLIIWGIVRFIMWRVQAGKRKHAARESAEGA